jgi:hypothetical protein
MVLRGQFVIFSRDCCIIALCCRPAYGERLCLAVARVNVPEYVDLRLYAVNSVSQVLTSYTVFANPVEYVIRRAVGDENVHAECRNFVPYSPDI